MDGPEGQQWFLRKRDDAQIFGPLPFEQLMRWASAAQVAPHDSVSPDGETWMKAPMLPQLEMDWLVEVTTERYYGPTTLGAIGEFIRLGEITTENFVLNSCDGSRRQILELPSLLGPAADHVQTSSGSAIDAAFAAQPSSAGMAIALQTRIRELEETLRDERRALREAEERHAALEQKCRQIAADLS